MFEQSWTPSLPPLVGTERQVNWATTERHKLLVLAEHALRIGRSRPELPEAAVRDTLDWLGSINDAGWWLDHRDLSGIALALRARWRGGRMASHQGRLTDPPTRTRLDRRL
jgi:hypothetical protein